MEHIHQLAKSPAFVRAQETPDGPVVFIIVNRLLDHVVLGADDMRALYKAMREFDTLGLLEG